MNHGYRIPLKHQGSRYASRQHRMAHHFIIGVAVMLIACAFAWAAPDLEQRRFYLSLAIILSTSAWVIALAQTRLYRRRFRTGISYHVPRMVMYGMVILLALCEALGLWQTFQLSSEHGRILWYLALLITAGCAVIILDHFRSYLRRRGAADSEESIHPAE